MPPIKPLLPSALRVPLWFLITSKDHYVFNLAWIKALPPARKKGKEDA